MLTSPKGGSEILLEELQKRVDTSPVNIILSTCDARLLHPAKPNILWEHLSYDQAGVTGLANADFVSRLDAIVFVSHWQHEQFRKRVNLPGDKCFVIQNCISPAPDHDKPQEVGLIYTSMPNRGLSLLAQAYPLMRNKVPLTVISGTKIYGKKFHETTGHKFNPLYRQLKALGAAHYDYLPNEEVREQLTKHHILAYPSVFEETSCLSAIEALSYGLKVVTTNFGALPETCGVWADYVPLGEPSEFIKRYAQALDHAVDAWQLNTDQVQHYRKYWTWDARPQWESLIGRYRTQTLAA